MKNTKQKLLLPSTTAATLVTFDLKQSTQVNIKLHLGGTLDFK